MSWAALLLAAGTVVGAPPLAVDPPLVADFDEWEVYQAHSVVQAAKDIDLVVPLVVRLEGTKVDEGKAIINGSGLNVIAANDLDDAAQKIVKAVKG